jgi:hypothetical protein
LRSDDSPVAAAARDRGDAQTLLICGGCLGSTFAANDHGGVQQRVTIRAQLAIAVDLRASG